MDKFSHVIYEVLVDRGVSIEIAEFLNLLILFGFLIIILIAIDWIARMILRKVSSGIANASKTKLDDLLISNRVPRRVGHLIPLFIAYWTTPYIFQDFLGIRITAIKALQILAVILLLRIIRSILNSFKDYFKTKPKLRDKPIDSYIQIFMLITWFAAIFFTLAVLAGIDIWKFLTGLGALSAIVILIFRDTILGFVASIQVATNDTVRIGDWITFDKYGADGDVIEINLSTVKVQNFDKTITSIPTYALIADSFKNWRGMNDSGGRRIKRAIYLKQDSIRFIEGRDVEKLKNIELIKEYILSRKNEIEKFNRTHKIDKSIALNGQNLTNIGVFRKYVESYIGQHPDINKEMTIMTRQLAPTSKGLPIEIYCFSKDKVWQNYEVIVADIFDHVLASVTYFDLEIFEFNNTIN